MEELLLVAIMGGAVLLVLLGTFLAIALWYRRLDSGTALVIRRANGSRVSFNNVVVLPIVHRAETIDLAVKPLTLECRGKDGMICRDSIRAEVTLTFYVRVNRTEEDVLKVADTIGCAHASDPERLRDLFLARFAEATRTVGYTLNFDELLLHRDQFKDSLIEVIGRDLNGFMLDDVAVASIDQTPISALDPDNVLDAEGMRKIAERSSADNIRTNELRQRERLEIARQNLEADEQYRRIEQQRAEAEARAGQGVHAKFIR
jgi:uncharacterized membrane protein YqiK